MSRLTVYGGGGGTAPRPMVVAGLGDSITGKYFADLCWRSAGRILFRASHVLSYSGQYTDTINTHVPDLVALTPKPDLAIVQAGTNDISFPRTVDQWKPSMQQLIASMQASGIPFVVLAVPPKTGAATAVANYNAWLGPYCRSQRVIFVDVYNVLVDATTGEWRAGYSDDGVHPNGVGTSSYATAIIAALGASLPAVPSRLVGWNSDANNLYANGCFLTDSNADGAADSWQWSSTGDDTPSLVAGSGADVGSWQRITRGTTGSRYFIQNPNFTGKIAAGDVLLMGCRVKVTTPGQAAMSGVLSLQFVLNGGAGQIHSQNVIADKVPDGSDLLIQQVSTAGAGVSGCYLTWSAGSTQTGTTIDVGQATLYNLTALGAS